jgi:glycosyltransferase A (GT-A) superfamily protein (DUF2064 family)
MVPAAWWFRHQVQGVLQRIKDPRWELILAVAPDRAGLMSRVWPADLPRIAQGQGDLGDRMARVMRSLPPGPVAIIGGDIPGVDKPRIARAFAALGHHDAVFGPAPDGGYWLVGCKRVGALPAGFMQNVRWSSEYALGDTMRIFDPARVALVDSLQDVDTLADLQATHLP